MAWLVTLLPPLRLTFVAPLPFARLVEETLTPLDPDRRAFRLVGEVLVERTVREVLPVVKDNRANVSTRGWGGMPFQKRRNF